MPKYIDLLRNHHKGPDKDKPAADELPDEDDIFAETGTDTRPAVRNEAPQGQAEHRTVPAIPDTDEWLNTCIRIMLAFLKSAGARKVVRIERLWKHLAPEISIVIKEPKQLSALELKVSEDTQSIRAMSEEYGGMLEKSMNMLLLSIKMGLQLRMSEQDILSLLLAAMLHHVGLARVPVAIRQKTSALTREERQTIRAAMRDGAEYLHECGIKDADTLLAVEQSQERIDGSGPMGLHGSEISNMGRIVGLLSFFEALIHYRPYRQRLLPRDAIRDIILHHKACFDTNLLKALIDAASLYPIGTYVQLNSGDVGQVIHVHPRLPLRPTVLLRMDRKGNPIVQREVDLQVQTTLLVERCMYPEDLERLL